ncbi:hybrid sensor histidine kinase/response regulator [Comamonas sp. JC664]|uniref:hybrid sensor histidine kinase/response regulator n=1 Tax=Comamonas sp. JC664 TaxID=2801917 RepID=UPI00174C8F93|nr:hybrid sensor histidine kinase/response regulator [Comamonas sp. JC664]MBL0697369.1 hybrid sensor histidine kinase/response regulator [Comamonas sp. JC664]GHG67324.1 hybrid sensor histidine kinase/response regulator [Comamonas sp. KCTC 72670]
MSPALRILLVDDSPADRFAVQRALERDEEQAWSMESVSSAEAALARIAEDPPDVVLVDFHLPGMTGLEMLRELQALGPAPRPAMVMLTGSGNERIAVEAMKSGAQDYLVKDAYSAERLRRCLRAAVDTVRMKRELEERRIQTERAERAAREALAVRDELFSLATHDLKGPLQIMTLNAQLLHRQLAKSKLGAAQLSRLEHITRAAHRMGELIDQFLETTRSEESSLNREPMDLLTLVRSKVHALEASGRHHFVLRSDGGDFTGDWDTRALERVLENLLGNAVKYSAEGTTVTVTLASEETHPVGHVRVQVTDEGMGIPSEDLPFVFERFRRGRNVSPGVTGSGVGLASARRLVVLHGGTIHVESEEGRGATFIVRLPRGAQPLEGLPDAEPLTSSTP